MDLAGKKRREEEKGDEDGKRRKERGCGIDGKQRFSSSAYSESTANAVRC